MPKEQRARTIDTDTSDTVAVGYVGATVMAPTLVAHDLGGPEHYGTLRLGQAPWAFPVDGSRPITGNVTVASSITIDGVDISAHAANPNAHHNRSHSVTSTSDHTITGSAFQVLGATATDTLGLLTPLADVSGATKEALLKSTSQGYLTVVNLAATGQVETPTLTATGNLTINPATDVLFPQAQIVRSDNFTPGYPIAGWQIGQHLNSATLNAMQIHSLTLDELRTRVFVADEVRVDRGEEFVTKSYGILAADFVTPAALDGTATIYFEDSPAISGAIFTSGDYILFRIFDDSSGLSITEIWGTVTSYADQPNDQQSWTFTLKYGPTSATVRRGLVAWDWGVSGQGYIHSSVVDTSGAPYLDIRHWTGAGGPYPTASPSPTFTTDVRIGQLISALDDDLAPTGYGLYASNAYLKGALIATNVRLDADGIRIRLPDISAWDDAYSIHFDREDDQEIFGGLYATWETEDAEAWDWQQYIHLKVYGADSYNAIYLDASSSGTGAGSIVLQAGLITDDERPLVGLYYDPNDNLNQISVAATEIVVTGAVTVTGHVIPSATGTYDLGSSSKTWRKVYVDEIVATTITGEEALGGQTWQYDDGDMYIKSSSSSTRTLYVSNPGSGTMHLDVEGNITVGGTVDGVDIAALGSSYDAHVTSANAHHNQSHVFATGSGLGADHTVSGLTTGHYIRATGATTAAFAAIVDGDLPATIVRTSRTISTGSGLTGGGDLSSNRTLDLADAVAGDGLTISSKVLAVELSATSGLELTGSSPAKTLQLADSVAGAGMTMTSKVLNVIAASGGGLTVNANDITLTWGTPTISTIEPDDAASYGSSGNPARSDHVHAIATAAPGSSSVNLSASTEGTGASFARAAHTHQLDVSIAPTWTGEHTFAANMVARHIRPQLTDTYDLGTSTMLWRKGWLSELDTIIFAKNTITLLGGWFYVTKDAGTWPVDLAASASNVNVDFGEAMTVGDFLVSRSSLAVEYFKIYAFVSGTTYTVQRNLDGSGANAWPAGTPFAVFGQSGNGRIELNAYDTPRISLLQQGATYNAQTELLRIGDLNGDWGYSTETYGFAVGERAASKVNLTLEATNGLRIFLNATGLAQWDASGNVSVGNTSTEHVYITSSGVQIKDGASVYTSLSGGTLTLGRTSDGEYVDISATNGLRIYGGGALVGQWDASGNVSVGNTSTEHVYITSSGVQIKDGASVYTSLSGGTLTLGRTSDGEYVDISSANGLRIYGGGLLVGQWTNAGKAVFGQVTNSKTRIEVDPTNGISIISRNGSGVDTTAISLTNAGSASFAGAITASSGTITGTLAISGSGKITAGSSTVDTTGVSIAAGTSWDDDDGFRFMSGTTKVAGLWGSIPTSYVRTKLYCNIVPSSDAVALASRNAVLNVASACSGASISAQTIINAANTSNATQTTINLTAGEASNSITFSVTPNVNGYAMWHSGNDGASSGLDADLLDGLHATSFLRADANTTLGNGYYLAADEVRARDSGGLLLRDDGGTLGIFIQDATGYVGIGTSSITTGVRLEVNGVTYLRDTLSLDGYLYLWSQAAPATPSAGQCIIYLDSGDGDLKVKFSNGVVRTLAAD